MTAAVRARRVTDDMAWIAPATFSMGSDEHHPEEAPRHRVTVDGFWIDRHEVTNSQFAQFVSDSGYVTVAERQLNPADFPGAPAENLLPGSLVFTGTPAPVDLRHLSQWWAWVPGACWRCPEGPSATVAGRLDHPVVQIAYEDACAYADWARKTLPSEAQWELAARGGIDGATYIWGEEPESPGARLANYWHGEFPWRAEPGYGTTTPVGSYPANAYGLFDMAGNVWEWTADWFSSHHTADRETPCCVPHDPRGGHPRESFDPAQPQFSVPRKVIKGGSFLCADSYCLRYRPAARRPQMIDTGMSHIGFRCVRTDRTPLTRRG
jgi:sulfatase modifying factor 1